MGTWWGGNTKCSRILKCVHNLLAQVVVENKGIFVLCQLPLICMYVFVDVARLSSAAAIALSYYICTNH